MSSLRDSKIALMIEKRRRMERKPFEQSFYAFVKSAWRYIDTSEFVDSWPVKAMCDHLQAVTRGDVRYLLENVTPRAGKSLITSVCWTPWIWAQTEIGPTSGPQVEVLAASYNDKLAQKLAADCRDLILSLWYQHYWGDRVKLRKDRNAVGDFYNTAGGARHSSSIRAGVIGFGYMVGLIDDPHNLEEVESDADRAMAERYWREFSSTRKNSQDHSAIVVNMQRLHTEDISGLIIKSDDYKDGKWTHLKLPMEYDPGKACKTVLKRDAKGNPVQVWRDPRTEQNELLFPTRFPADAVRRLKISLGPYMAAGRLQQEPSPATGGLLDKAWWKLWDAPDGQFPPCHFVMASADTAFTENESNDPTGFVVLGVWTDPVDRIDKVMLLYAWRKFLNLRGVDCERGDRESYSEWKQRTYKRWGLIEWIGDSCKKFQVDHLVVESKASGLSVIQEMKRLYAGEGWHIEGKTPEGDKVARAVSVQGLLSGGLVYAPDRDWAATVIEETSVFPRHRYRDLTDALTQGLSHLRKLGRLRHQEEVREAELLAGRFQPELVPLYDV